MPAKTILLTWELGANFGHVGPMLLIARRLREHGHRPVFALRDVVGPRPILEDSDFPVLQAPVWPKPAALKGRPFAISGYADILAMVGFLRTEDLAAMVSAWDAVLDLVRPDLVVADHSPTLCLAAYGEIPIAVVGIGYAVPPIHADTFPPLFPDRPTLVPEYRLVETIHAVQRRRGRRGPPTLPALFDAPVRAIWSFPELDPYRADRQEPTLGPLEPLPDFVPPPDEPSLYAYLGEEFERLDDFAQCLADIKASKSVYLRGDVASLERFLAGQGVTVFERPPSLREVVPKSTVVVSHGGLTTAHAALAAGRAQLLLPLHVEAQLTADALKALGLGIYLGRDASKDQIRESLRRIVHDRKYLDNAVSYAQAIARRPRVDALGETVDACLKVLS